MVVKGKDAEAHARELVDMIATMRRQMAMQDGTIQRQAAQIDVLRAAGDQIEAAAVELTAVMRRLHGHGGRAECIVAADDALAAWREVRG